MGISGLLGKVGQVVLSAIAIALLGLWAAFHLGVMGASAKSYDCENMKAEMIALSEKNAAQNSGITLIGIVGEETVSTSDALVECKGKAKWSNATEGSISYKAYAEDGQWWLQYNPT